MACIAASSGFLALNIDFRIDAAVIDKVLYHYYSRRHFGWRLLLDTTPALRHAFGPRLVSGPRRVNRISLGRQQKSVLRSAWA